MRIKIIVWGSREWYDEAIPLLTAAGFAEVAGTHWADPETDGERMGFTYAYKGEDPLSTARLEDLLARLHAILSEAEAPLESIEVTDEPA